MKSFIFADTLILQPAENIRLSWIEAGLQKELEISLIDSVSSADIVMISILPESDRFEIFYHF